MEQIEKMSGIKYLYLIDKDNITDHQLFYDHFGLLTALIHCFITFQGRKMVQLRKNKLFLLAALILLAMFCIVPLHFMEHATGGMNEHGHEERIDLFSCDVCHLISVLSFMLLVVLLSLITKPNIYTFVIKEPQFIQAFILNTPQLRAPPVIS